MSNSECDKREDVHEEDIPWITWWCSLPANEFLCEVHEAFIRDQFNLTGLSRQHYEETLEVLLDIEHDRQLSFRTMEVIQESAELLYGLIHARYILTTHGLNQMSDKFKRGEFGCCPRVYCSGQRVVPVGCSDRFGEHTVKLFCPNCNDLYFPKSVRQCVDGSFFGTTFPHMLFHAHPELLPPCKHQQPYVPRIFGFRIHASAHEVKAQLEQLGQQQQQQQEQLPQPQPATPVPQ